MGDLLSEGWGEGWVAGQVFSSKDAEQLSGPQTIPLFPLYLGGGNSCEPCTLPSGTAVSWCGGGHDHTLVRQEIKLLGGLHVLKVLGTAPASQGG